jgi:hypothetical protein
LAHFVLIWYIFPFWYHVPTKIWQSCFGISFIADRLQLNFIPPKNSSAALKNPNMFLITLGQFLYLSFFNTQQSILSQFNVHNNYELPKNLILWRESNPGLQFLRRI